MEVPIRKVLLGFEFDKVVNPDSMGNPDSLQFFKELAIELNEKKYSSKQAEQKSSVFFSS